MRLSTRSIWTEQSLQSLYVINLSKCIFWLCDTLISREKKNTSVFADIRCRFFCQIIMGSQLNSNAPVLIWNLWLLFIPKIPIHYGLFIYFVFSATKELHSPDGDSTTAPPSQSSEQSEVKNKVDFVLNPLQITSCSDVGSPPQTPSVKKIKKVCYFFLNGLNQNLHWKLGQ